MLGNRLFIVAILAAAATILAACSGSESAESATSVADQATETAAVTSTPSTTSAPSPTTTAAPARESQTSTTTVTSAPEEVEPTCDWDSPRLSSGDASEPTGPGDDVALAVLGSWQHTHINEGGGFKPVKPTTDIRYVLSSDTFLYCQDVQGATEHGENSVRLVLEGDEIVLPSPATGYKIVAWNENMMVWLNHFDDSLYLLQRR
ncbi:MAG: hypothetical protein M3092_00700 [Actinomycetia bacterium]|nr:hypothetical protein [Actinomycetes bacterium]